MGQKKLLLLGAGAMLLTGPSALRAATVMGAGTPWAASVKAALARQAQEESSESASLKQKGLASWYTGRALRHNTGRKSDVRMTAAHRTAPIGTHLIVTDRDTGRSVEVTVNDRGPFIGDRVIDLSQTAAARLGIINRGVANVTVEKADESIVEVAQAPEKKQKRR